MTSIFVALVQALVALALYFMYKGARVALTDERKKTAELRAELAKRDDTIKRMQEAYDEQANRTAAISTGAPAERVGVSLDVLRDISKAGASRAAAVAGRN